MKVILISIVLICAGVSFTDSAVMFEFPDGRTVALTSNGDIEMVAESVSIVPAGGMYEPWGDGEGWLPLMNVRCIFHLENTSDRSQDITVGFPIDAKFGDSYTVFNDSMLVAMFDTMYNNDQRLPWYSSGMEDGEDAVSDVPEELNFTAEADGVPLDVFYRSCMYSLEEEMVHRPVVAVWRMHFDAGQKVRLVNTYSTAWDYFGGGPWADYSVRYVLTTGATWKGNIGTALITLEVPDELPRPGFTDTLFTSWSWAGGPVIEGSTVSWEFTDLEPDADLEFRVSTEMGVGHWDYSITAPSLVESVKWTRDSLLSSTSEFITHELTWGPTFHTELVFRIAEAALYINRGQDPPSETVLPLFSNVHIEEYEVFSREDLQKLKVLDEVQGELQLDIELAREAGYLRFLPRFAVDLSWVAGHITSFSAMESIEDSYLELLENLHAAQNGALIEDPAVRAFYNLTGWYHPGDSLLYNRADFADSLSNYMNMRELQ